MANQADFYYWYRRYKVRSVDMMGFQAAMIDSFRGLSEGLLDSVVLKGFDVLPGPSGITVAVSGGIAAGASGYLQVVNSGIVLDVTAATTGTFPTRSLIVARPMPTDSNFINSPTSPFNQVPLNSLQSASVLFLAGTPSATPTFPATGANDVILAGLIVPPSTTSISQIMIDYEVRSVIGKHSLISQNQLRYDDRLRPFRLSNTLLGVKPSRGTGSAPQTFMYPGKLTPSLYPVSGGVYVAADSFYNFQTGGVTGADGTTAAFTPTIPTSNNSIVCSVTLHSNDTLAFSYGVQGTLAQCLNAIQNQVFGVSAGSLAAQDGGFPVAFVIVSSFSGSLSDLQVFDGRAFVGSSSSGSGSSGGFVSHGTRSVPQTITAVGGIAISTDLLQQWFVNATSGATPITANPQISNGNNVAQKVHVTIIGSTNYPVFSNGTGLKLTGTFPDPNYAADAQTLELSWDGTQWSEDSRSAPQGDGTNSKFSLTGSLTPFVAIDGLHYQKVSQKLASVFISMLDSGQSGSTVVQVNQYRSGSLVASATASISASSGNPIGSQATLTSTLSLLAGDVISVDVVSVANGSPDTLSVEF